MLWLRQETDDPEVLSLNPGTTICSYIVLLFGKSKINKKDNGITHLKNLWYKLSGIDVHLRKASVSLITQEHI